MILKSDGGWIKKFYDNQEEYGFDSLVKSKKSSWSKGRLHDIESVFLFNKECLTRYALSIPNTEWHQFDRFCCISNSDNEPVVRRMARVVQAKINQEHILMNLSKRSLFVSNSKQLTFFFFLESLESGLKGDNILTQQAVGQWLSLILLPDNSHAVQLSERGKISWQEVHI